MERINPFSDYGFKLIFGREESKPLLIGFLNSLLVGEKEILDLTYLNTEQLPEIKDGRRSIYDVFCTTSDHESIIVEMQFEGHANFKERALYYLSRTIVNQGERGSDWQFKVNAVYGVFLMNFRFTDSNKFRTDVILADRDTGKLFCNKLRQIFLELPEFTKNEHECVTNFERWIYTLKNMENLKTIPFQPYIETFRQLEKITNLAGMSKKERMQYDQSVKVYRDNMATLEYVSQKGREEGRKEGLSNVARSMKSRGTAPSEISEITGLSLDEINAL